MPSASPAAPAAALSSSRRDGPVQAGLAEQVVQGRRHDDAAQDAGHERQLRQAAPLQQRAAGRAGGRVRELVEAPLQPHRLRPAARAVQQPYALDEQDDGHEHQQQDHEQGMAGRVL
jgi:hypothetical protein